MSNLTHTPSTRDYGLEADRRGCFTRFTIYGRQTEESCQSSDDAIFDEIEAWLGDAPTFPVVIHRADAIGMFFTAFESEMDAAIYKLAWGDPGMVSGTASSPFS